MPAPKAHPIKELLAAYDVAFQEQFGVPAPLSPAKDAALAKRLLSRYSLEQLRGWVGEFMASEDAFIVRSGFTFGAFVACLGKVITARHAKRAAVPAWQRRNLPVPDDWRTR